MPMMTNQMPSRTARTFREEAALLFRLSTIRDG